MIDVALVSDAFHLPNIGKYCFLQVSCLITFPSPIYDFRNPPFCEAPPAHFHVFLRSIRPARCKAKMNAQRNMTSGSGAKAAENGGRMQGWESVC